MAGQELGWAEESPLPLLSISRLLLDGGGGRGFGGDCLTEFSCIVSRWGVALVIVGSSSVLWCPVVSALYFDAEQLIIDT